MIPASLRCQFSKARVTEVSICNISIVVMTTVFMLEANSCHWIQLEGQNPDRSKAGEVNSMSPVLPFPWTKIGYLCLLSSLVNLYEPVQHPITASGWHAFQTNPSVESIVAFLGKNNEEETMSLKCPYLQRRHIIDSISTMLIFWMTKMKQLGMCQSWC